MKFPQTPIAYETQLSLSYWHVAQGPESGDPDNPYTKQMLQTLDAAPLSKEFKEHFARLLSWSITFEQHRGKSIEFRGEN